MRVLHLVSVATKTGPADPALEIAHAQRTILGWDAAIAFDRVRAGDMSERAAELGVPADASLSLCTKGGVIRALKDVRNLAELSKRYDLIHCHASHDHGLAALARRSGGPAKLVRSIHHGRSTKRRPFQAIAYRRTDAFSTVAEAHRAELLSSYPHLDPARVMVVPGAVDPARFSPHVSGRSIRAEQGIPAGARVIGMIARFQPGRRQTDLIRAMAQVGEQAWLVLIGKGETQAEIEAAIHAAGIAERTRLYGFRGADLPEAIASCDVTVLLQEGSDAGCRAVLQSLACGVPVIGARWPAIAEAIEGSRSGWLIEPGDQAALAAALREALALSVDERAALSERARRRILERYTETQRVEAIAELYRRA